MAAKKKKKKKRKKKKNNGAGGQNINVSNFALLALALGGSLLESSQANPGQLSTYEARVGQRLGWWDLSSYEFQHTSEMSHS
mmetsp:Transcript_53048/g.116124  ORF Transcript_53048/g.116124 Transcript_53048/m.116124 type:complete len:82 (+) Transcript_53048:2682-2927(+)